jgi:hypothetical protein
MGGEQRQQTFRDEEAIDLDTGCRRGRTAAGRWLVE